MKRDDRPGFPRLALRKRRVALGLHCAFQVLCAIGSQGTWWQVVTGTGAPFGDPRVGGGDPANLALFACAAAFFFASYDLVADADLQAPVLVASLLALGAAGWVFYQVYVDERTIQEAVRAVEGQRVSQYLASVPPTPPDAAPVTSGAGVAPVASGDGIADVIGGARIRFRWGLALFLSSALAMSILSVYLTFVARREAT